MSVINSVLKDLESRSSQFTPIEIAAVENLTERKPKQTVSYAIALLSILLLAGLAFGFYLFQQGRVVANNQSEPASMTPAPVTQQIQLPVEPALPANQIIDLQIRESIDDMTLEFSLREKVVSYLKERTEHSFVYHLRNIQSEIVAPVISQNRWIEKLSLLARDEGVDISFRTVTGVLVETRQISEDGTQVWSIKLKKVARPVEVVKQVEVPVRAAVEAPKGDSKATKVVEMIEQKIETPAEIPAEALAETPAEVAAETKVVKLDIKSSQKKLSSGEQLQKAWVSIKNRRWNEAETVLLGLIEGPQDLAARTRLLSIYLQRQQAGRFSTLVRESIDRYPQQALFKTEYARSLFQLKGYAEVIELLRAERDANATQLALLAASHQRLDQHQQALDYYQQSLNKDARQSKNWIGLGISQEQTAQFEDARRSYVTAAKIGKLNTRLQAFVEERMEQLAAVVN
ncbi:MAG: hypothetical protein V3R76_10800 [Gammaproteobacteria bacterium]